jgi:dihydrofolate synthase / folylpolyglutamate synthase
MADFSIDSLSAAQLILQQFSKHPSGAHNPAVLGRMQTVMRKLGDPQDRLKVIHVAGTSGKTSTAYYLSSLLTGAGKRVGLSISPYTYELTERLQLNGRKLTSRQFCAELEKFLHLFTSIDVDLSYLELLTAFAFWELDRLAVDCAIVETNAGGRYDATNITSRADKVCVITDIGYDHTDILGSTLPHIAGNKAGIIHADNLAIMLQQEWSIVRVMDNQCRKVGARLVVGISTTISTAQLVASETSIPRAGSTRRAASSDGS